MFVTDSSARHQNAFANMKKIAKNKTDRILGSLPTWLKEVPGLQGSTCCTSCGALMPNQGWGSSWNAQIYAREAQCTHHGKEYDADSYDILL